MIMLLAVIVLRFSLSFANAMDSMMTFTCKTPKELTITCVKGRFSKKTGLYSEKLNPPLLKRFMNADSGGIQEAEVMSDPNLIMAAKYLRYSRFTDKLLHDNISEFTEKKKMVPEITIDSLLDRRTEMILKKEVIADILDLCSIVLPEDNVHRLVFSLIERKRFLLNELFELTSDAIEIIASDDVLAHKAYQMVNYQPIKLKLIIFCR